MKHNPKPNPKRSPQKTEKTKLKDYINWFEIPVLDLDRAIYFYNFIYGIEMEKMEIGDYSMAIFPAENGIGGALVAGQGCIPSEVGALIYLNAGDDLAPVLARVAGGGGRVVMDKTLIDDDSGYFSLFIDSEGNRLALHSKH